MSIKSVDDDEIMKPELNRNAFLRCYGAIIHSSQFRRLSHKTQVHLNPNFDFVRTRLTHSLEVSQIGRQLARIFINELNLESSEYSTNGIKSDFSRDFEELTATACLSHDIGQAPFGHAGEKKLSNIIEAVDSSLRFDANKQNIRLLVGSEARDAYDVPYCLVDSLMKYKNEEMFGGEKGASYEEEKKDIDKILAETGLTTMRHPACSLMEAADDIAYLCGDIEDGIKHKLISKSELLKLLEKIPVLDGSYNCMAIGWEAIIEDDWVNPQKITNYLIKAFISHCNKTLKAFNLDQTNLDDLPEYFENKIKDCHNNDEKLNLLYCDTDASDNLGQAICELKGIIYKEHILKSPKLNEAEFFSEKILENLFNEFFALKSLSSKEIRKNKLFSLFPSHVQEKVKDLFDNKTKDNDKIFARLIVDYISGMTDRYAIYFWEKINSPQSLKLVS